MAAKNGDKNILELLLQHEANINARDLTGRTALALAVRKGKVEIVRFLIERKADVNTVNVRGNTPLIHSKSAEMSRLLLEAGATKTIDHMSNQPEVGSALHWAVRKGLFETVELLLQYGANINARDQNGRTALALAKQGGNKKIARLLSINGAII